MDRAARRLLESRLSRTPIGPAGISEVPGSESAGYGIQKRLHALLSAEGRGDLVGYKVGATSPDLQRALGLSGPAAGGMFANCAHLSGVSLRRDAFRRPGVECEIALTLGTDLDPGGAPYGTADVARAVAACHAAIEVVDNRFSDLAAISAPELIADDMLHAACVLGPPVGTVGDLAATRGHLTFNGQAVGSGRGSDLMGHPHAVLAWLANRLADNGQPLRAGYVILCGSVVPLQWLDDHPGGPLTVVARFEELGEARVHFR